jgi:hypothetical protein
LEVVRGNEAAECEYGCILALEGECEGALAVLTKCLERVKCDKEWSVLLINIGMCYIRLGYGIEHRPDTSNPKDARSMFERVMRVRVGDAQVLFGLALCSIHEVNDDLAIKYLQQANPNPNTLIQGDL